MLWFLTTQPEFSAENAPTPGDFHGGGRALRAPVLCTACGKRPQSVLLIHVTKSFHGQNWAPKLQHIRHSRHLKATSLQVLSTGLPTSYLDPAAAAATAVRQILMLGDQYVSGSLPNILHSSSINPLPLSLQIRNLKHRKIK